MLFSIREWRKTRRMANRIDFGADGCFKPSGFQSRRFRSGMEGFA